jgi:uncharacterized protein (UPF0548 family)
LPTSIGVVVSSNGDLARCPVHGEVTFGIAVFSRPADLLGRIGQPVVRAVQKRVTSAYLEGVWRYVADGW